MDFHQKAHYLFIFKNGIRENLIVNMDGISRLYWQTLLLDPANTLVGPQIPEWKGKHYGSLTHTLAALVLFLLKKKKKIPPLCDQEVGLPDLGGEKWSTSSIWISDKKETIIY